MILFELYIASLYKISKKRLGIYSFEKTKDILSMNFFCLNLTLIIFPFLILFYLKTYNLKYVLIIIFLIIYYFLYKKLEKKFISKITEEYIMKCFNKFKIPSFFLYMYWFLIHMIILCISPFFSIWTYTLLR